MLCDACCLEVDKSRVALALVLVTAGISATFLHMCVCRAPHVSECMGMVQANTSRRVFLHYKQTAP